MSQLRPSEHVRAARTALKRIGHDLEDAEESIAEGRCGQAFIVFERASCLASKAFGHLLATKRGAPWRARTSAGGLKTPHAIMHQLGQVRAAMLAKCLRGVR